MVVSAGSRPRIVATTDGEIDDRCSMIRFLMYANEWDIEGIVYSSSRFHWDGHDWAGIDWIEAQIDEYARVYERLTEHDSAYPAPEALRDLIYVGNIDDVGAMDADTPGSDCIVEVLLEDKPGPIYLQAWGGTNTIARALWKIQHEHPDRMAEVAEKAVIYIILNQDRTLRECIQPNWPELQVLNSFKQFRAFAYRWDELVPEEQRRFLEDEWMEEHVVTGHGPLCSAYPTADGDGGYFVSEGDTPSFLHQIRVGLGGLEHPGNGGWGGRFEREPGSRNVWIGAEDDRDLYKPLWRWIPDVQRDWAARADWCVESYDEANHPPAVVVNGDPGMGVVRIRTRPGATEDVDAAGTSDPDGDDLDYRWWRHREADRFDGSPPPVEIADAQSKRTAIEVPEDAEEGEYHVILTVTDDGEPNLSRYRRVVLDVRA